MRKYNAESSKKIPNPVEASDMSNTVLAVEDKIEYGAYVGLDVHKDTIAIAVAESGRGEPLYEGEIANNPYKVFKLVERLYKRYGGQVLLWCYEAGPCGYVLYHQLMELGEECHVVAPSKTPRKPGDRIKTDRRDALILARQLRSGDLTAVWVPDSEQEAMRDLTRTRDDFKAQEHKARQQLNAFVLRHGYHWPSGKKRWTQTHYNWLESLKFEHEWLQIVLQEYIHAVKLASARVDTMTTQMMELLPQWSLAPVVDCLVALRGVDKISAMILLAELGDISRFDSPKQLMAYLGLVPSEHSSGKRRRQGGITLTGNGRGRRALIESGWSYRFPARKTKHLKHKEADASEGAKAIAWKAQKRLCGRYRTLTQAGKNTKLVCVAIARELVGFIWDIVRHEMPKLATR